VEKDGEEVGGGGEVKGGSHPPLTDPPAPAPPPCHADVCVSAARCGVGCDDGGLSCHDRYVCV